MDMIFEYFYGSESEQFTFYRIPKILFKSEYFKDISTGAKVLYGLMLDRMGLSMKNGWIDGENRVYIIYTIAEIMDDLNCADQKVGKLLSELDTTKGIGLIERKRRGLGKPNIIYVKNFGKASQIQRSEKHKSGIVEITNQETIKSQIKNSVNQKSGEVNSDNQELQKAQINNTNINNTDFNDTNRIISNPIGEVSEADAMRWIEERKSFEAVIKGNIGYDTIVQEYGKEWLDEIVEIMVDVVCSSEPFIRINKEPFPKEIVKNRFLKINGSHIEYINMALKNNTSDVRNIRAFLITTIYRSFETVDNWFSAKVNYDMAQMKT